MLSNRSAWEKANASQKMVDFLLQKRITSYSDKVSFSDKESEIERVFHTSKEKLSHGTQIKSSQHTRILHCSAA